jgi:hypothetical protein
MVDLYQLLSDCYHLDRSVWKNLGLPNLLMVEPSQLTNWKEGIKDNDFHDLRKVTLFFYAAFICNIFPAEYLIESQYWYVFIFDIGPFQ